MREVGLFRPRNIAGRTPHVTSFGRRQVSRSTCFVPGGLPDDTWTCAPCARWSAPACSASMAITRSSEVVSRSLRAEQSEHHFPRRYGGQFPVGRAQARSDIPRGSDGKPDLSGIWQVLNSAAWDLQRIFSALWACLPDRVSWKAEQSPICPLPPQSSANNSSGSARPMTRPEKTTCTFPSIARATSCPSRSRSFRRRTRDLLGTSSHTRADTSSPTRSSPPHKAFPISG